MAPDIVCRHHHHHLTFSRGLVLKKQTKNIEESQFKSNRHPKYVKQSNHQITSMTLMI